MLPDLFKEGKGVVAQGQLGADGAFHATEVLAKHDENYMPPEAAEAIEQAQKRRRTAERGADAASTKGQRDDSRDRTLRADRSRCSSRSCRASLPIIGAARGDAALMAVARAGGARAVRAGRARVRLPRLLLRHQRFLRRRTSRAFELAAAAHYRFAATWGSHEGSLLLWSLMLAGWTRAVTLFSRHLPTTLRRARARA